MSFTIPFPRGAMTAAALLLCLTGIGCRQVSHVLRSEPVAEGESVPPAPELQPAPQLQTPLYVPPPAPPTEAAELGLSDDLQGQVDPEFATREEGDDFFDAAPSMPSSFMRERGDFSAARLAEKGRKAAARRDLKGQQQLPLIVPATLGLTRVSGEEPELLPVPHGK